MRDGALVRLAAGAHLVHGGDTNWVILADGDAVTLVDTGYPGHHARLLASLAALGHTPEAVTAVLVTHAHSDHIGSAAALHRRYGTPVLGHPAEVPHLRRAFTHQVTPGQVLRAAWRPGVAPWAVRALRSGGTRDVRVTGAGAFPVAALPDRTPEGAPDGSPGAPLDLPGGPVPVPTPGHTDGHCAYLLPGPGVLLSGDALVTGHPTSRLRGPQLLPGMFHRDRSRALASLAVLERLPADVLAPGHGPVHRGPLDRAAALARGRAPR
ncbi:MBL fold metallo-hydrolase [Streptomyces sp. LP05-1]|uniref:MBL fold metallo-hydrolase n=1 Tax=Streptomyces pyxinae TaxID=2970734 RepID=A0ABT2CHA1_9ACTN|nr:MBL fold metallo-hydrolase [Streptomyces sp. LP05-1]MCS0636778.1 MBL fold metallo-hydrolase [Streptomyces sp. LP05-1]